MGHVHLLRIVVGQAAAVIQLVEVANQIAQAVCDVLRRRFLLCDGLQLLLENLNDPVESLVDSLKVKVGARVVIACKLQKHHCVGA